MVRTKHRIGGYRVIAPIGAGGFATVYRALNESSGQEVAIKVLAENHSLVADTRRRFVEEVGLLQTVDSPSIAKIYEVGETETGQPFMVLELADRGDLRRRLEEIRGSHQVLNRADLAMLAHHLYDSLTTLHRAEIVHRDVSPGNILIRSRRAPGQRANARNGGVTLLEPGERFLLADLGHAKDMILASGFTAGGGTRGFASPEQRDEITVVDLRADIFSATAILEWAAHDGEFAEDLEPFFDIGLAADPEDRFTSMTEWHAAFSAALGSGGADGGAGVLTMRGLADYMITVPERVDRRSFAVAMGALALGGAVAFAAISGLGGNATEAGDELRLDSEGVPLSTIEVRGTLRVLQNDDIGGARASTPGSPETTAPAGATGDTVDPDETTTSEATTTEAESTTVTEAETTVTTEASTTSEATTTSAPSTTEPVPEVGLDAEIQDPLNEETIIGDLRVSGTATFPQAVGTVELVIRNLETGVYWHPETGAFQPEFHRFTIDVDGANDAATWVHVIPEGIIESGPYRIRAWARAADGRNDPFSDSRIVFVL